jgi:hypothetical protein
MPPPIPQKSRAVFETAQRNFDPFPHAPGISPYVSTGDYLLGLHERRRAAHMYVWPIMSDEISRAYVYVGQGRP